jgi:hypothetical protein
VGSVQRLGVSLEGMSISGVSRNEALALGSDGGDTEARSDRGERGFAFGTATASMLSTGTNTSEILPMGVQGELTDCSPFKIPADT